MEQIISIKNGKKQTAIFSVTEMGSRLTKLRSSMEKENVDAVFFTSIHNINYYNHFVYCSFGRPYVTLNSGISKYLGIGNATGLSENQRRNHFRGYINHFHRTITKTLKF